MSESACRICKRIVKGNMCPVCKSTDVSKSWKSLLIILDSDSEFAKAVGITAPGKYAIRVK